MPSISARSVIFVEGGMTATVTAGAARGAEGGAPTAARGAESNNEAARMTAMAERDRTYAKFTFFKVDPAWQRRDRSERAEDKREFLAASEDYARDRPLRAYSTVGTRGDVDLMLLAQSP